MRPSLSLGYVVPLLSFSMWERKDLPTRSYLRTNTAEWNWNGFSLTKLWKEWALISIQSEREQEMIVSDPRHVPLDLALGHNALSEWDCVSALRCYGGETCQNYKFLFYSQWFLGFEWLRKERNFFSGSRNYFLSASLSFSDRAISLKRRPRKKALFFHPHFRRKPIICFPFPVSLSLSFSFDNIGSHK